MGLQPDSSPRCWCGRSRGGAPASTTAPCRLEPDGVGERLGPGALRLRCAPDGDGGRPARARAGHRGCGRRDPRRASSPSITPSFLWQSLVSVLVEIVVVTLVMALAAPSAGASRDAAALGIRSAARRGRPPLVGAPATPGERLERSPLLTLLRPRAGVAYLVMAWRAASRRQPEHHQPGRTPAGFALHRTPANLMKAVRDATPATWGVLLHFRSTPHRGMIAMTKLNERIAHPS